MARQRHFFGQSLFHRPARGLALQGAARRLVLHIERLEDRFLMNGDPSPLAATPQNLLTMADDVRGNAIDADAIFSPAETDVARLALDYQTPLTHFFPTASPAEQAPFNRINEIPDWLIAEADKRHGSSFGKSTFHPTFSYRNFNPVSPIFTSNSVGFDSLRATIPSLATTNDAVDFSTTNTQVAGVDEADLVETDGEYLYLIAEHDLLIIDVRDSDNPTLASRIRLDDQPMGIYLAGDRLTLISEGQSQLTQGISGGWLTDRRFGYWHHATTKVQVLDLTDRSAPKLVQSTELDGRVVDSRMVDGDLRLVLQHDSMRWTNFLPYLQQRYIGFNEANQAREYRYETRTEYLGRVHSLLKSSNLPGYRTLTVDGQVLQENLLVSYKQLYENKFSYHQSATTIATFDTQSNAVGPSATKTLLTKNATEIYSTKDSLYVFGEAIDSSYRNLKTTIWKYDFDASDHSISLSAQGSVDGRLLNQFSADEHDGFLRVVTSSWIGGHSLFVLQQVGQNFEQVGAVKNLAPDERLYSVRFMEDEAFVVTFRLIDPLFAIDLSDPTKPVVAGELKIPGYSDYLQPLTEDHLLGIGRAANESSGLFREMQISIFDVSDLDDPTLAHRYSFEGGRNTTSIATGASWSQGDGEHHAVSYFPSDEILAMPISIDRKSSLRVFHVDIAAGFQPLATIEHDSRILRSLQIDEQLVVVSSGQVTVHNLRNPSQTVADLDLQIGSAVGLVELTAYVPPEMLGVVQRLTTTLTDRSSFELEKHGVATQPTYDSPSFLPTGNQAPIHASDVVLEALETIGASRKTVELDPHSVSAVLETLEFKDSLDAFFGSNF